MFTFFDAEIFRHDWLIVFEQDGEITKIHNDRDALERFLSSIQILIGYNNYAYDNKIIAALLKDLDPYETSQKIISNQRFGLRLNRPVTLDVMQELRGLSLKEAQANLGLDIIETPIDFNLDRKLTTKEIEKVFKYCENDVLTTKTLFEKREIYFSNKFELVNSFKLPASDLTKTRAQLSASILKAKTYAGAEKDRLVLQLDKRFKDNRIPSTVMEFYQSLIDRFERGHDPEELEKEKLTYSLCGVDHQYGLGGLHGAIKDYKSDGKYMQIDVSSFYPSLAVNYGLLSRAATEPGLYKEIYDSRRELKDSKDPKQEAYKLVLNASLGASKSPYNTLYDPRQFNSITVNGQLILTNLVTVLEPYIKLIQSNTDGIIIEYENEELIRGMVEDFGWYYNLAFDIDLIDKIAQKDVSNYVVRLKDGRIHAKGRFGNYDGGNFESNSLTIIDKALVDYYIHGIRPNQTVVNCWKKNELHWFQNVVKAGSFDGMAQEIRHETLFEGSYDKEFVKIQNVNRVFATKEKTLGPVFRTRKDGETKYAKVPYTSDNCLVWNNSLEKLDRRKVDLTWYIREIEKFLF